MRRLCFLALVLFLNPACSTTSTSTSVFHRFDELDMSREFSSQTIDSKSFVMNVTNIEEYSSSREPMNAVQATALLQGEFHRLRPDLRPLEPTLNAADKKSLGTLLEQFAGQQEFPVHGYKFLQKPALASSWFLIADVEGVNETQNVTEEDIKDSKGQKIDTKYSFVSSRLVQVRYFIYDPAAGHLVFSGLIRSTTDAVNDRVGRDDEGAYPDVPGLGKSLAQNFQKFLRALPATQGY